MSRTLWLNHCLQMAGDLRVRLNHMMSENMRNEMLTRLRVELTRKEFEQLALEMRAFQQYFSADEPSAPVDEINLCGVAFVQGYAEYTEKLRTDLRKLHVENAHLRGLLYDENLRNLRRDLGRLQPDGRRALDSGAVRCAPSNQPGTNRGGST